MSPILVKNYNYITFDVLNVEKYLRVRFNDNNLMPIKPLKMYLAAITL
jgi:hypothetical protein